MRLKMKQGQKARKVTFHLKKAKKSYKVPSFLKASEPENAPVLQLKKEPFFRPGVELALRLLRAA